jgi:flagellar biosynthesis/type III secretory pathway M-ring protein FliF/YscJ
MRELLQSLLQRLQASTAATRLVIGVGLAGAVLVAGYSSYRASNPHMMFFRGDLDAADFSALTTALGNAGIRFETSTGSAPYSVWIESGKKHAAWNAVALEGALDVGPRGIDTSGSASAFDASIERVQRATARHWQEVEKQLSLLTWVSGAKVTTSTPPRGVLGRQTLPTVSVVLLVRGATRPSVEQGSSAAAIVQRAFGVPPENVTITDQRGIPLFHGDEDRGLATILEFQHNYDAEMTAKAQEYLDRTYGPGMAAVSVHGEWLHDRVESVDENIDPKKKLIVSEAVEETVTPSAASIGGPAGVQSILATPAAASTASPVDPATTNDSTRQYAYGTTTTHKLQNQPRLQRLSVTLLLDSSKAAEQEAAADVVKALVGFDETRKDLFTVTATKLHGLERDAEGNPLPFTAPEIPAAPSQVLTLLLERGVELIAAATFLFLLLRTLKRSKKPIEQQIAEAEQQAEAAIAAAAVVPDVAEELDEDALARRHVEDLIDSDPEKVSALLSRWAMGEDYYARSR